MENRGWLLFVFRQLSDQLTVLQCEFAYSVSDDFDCTQFHHLIGTHSFQSASVPSKLNRIERTTRRRRTVCEMDFTCSSLIFEPTIRFYIFRGGVSDSFPTGQWIWNCASLWFFLRITMTLVGIVSVEEKQLRCSSRASDKVWKTITTLSIRTPVSYKRTSPKDGENAF